MIKSNSSELTRYKMAWLALPLIATFNGVLRDLTYRYMFGDHLANQISSVLLSVIIIWFVILLNERIRLQSPAQAWSVGVTWLILTIFFELLLTLATGGSLNDHLSQYDIKSGNLWILVLITVCVAPVALRRFPSPGHAR